MPQRQLVFVDCHCHLTSDRFQHDLDAVLMRAERAGVHALFVCSTSQLDMLRVLDLSRAHRDRIFPCLGLHPLDGTFGSDVWAATRSMIVSAHQEQGIAAIGEVGLDFSKPLLRQQGLARGTSEAEARESQIACFEAHVALALELGLPLNVHSRNAERETLEILARARCQAVMHAYKGDPELAVDAANTCGLFFSFPPSIVYKQEYQAAAKALPDEALLLETDSPSLAAGGPKERNEPSRIGLAAAKIAELRGTTLEDIAELTTRNASRLFGTSVVGLDAFMEPRDAGGKKTTRWRQGAKEMNRKPPESCSDGSAAEGAGTASAMSARSRWRAARRSSRLQSGGAFADPTLCSAAYGRADCG